MPKRLRFLCVLFAAALIPVAVAAPLLDAASARLAALQQYRLDLVRILALRADAPHLMAAAMLARHLADPPEHLDYTSLIKRAGQADDAGAMLAWARLAECRDRYLCPSSESLATLTELAPDNAAVWLLKLDASYRAGDVEAARQALHRAIAADGYDDYAGQIRQALAEAVTSLPVPAEVVDAYAGGSEAGPASAQLFLAASAAARSRRPRFVALVRLCDPEQELPASARLQADCLALAHILAWGSSPQARATGLHLIDQLADDPSIRKQARQQQADLVWQVRNMSRLRLQAFSDGELASELLALARSGDRQMSMIYAALRDRDIPLSADAAKPPAKPQPEESVDADATQP